MAGPLLRRTIAGVRRRYERAAHLATTGEARDELVRGWVFDLLGRHASLVAVDGPDARYLVSTADRTISRGAFVAGEYQLDLMAAALGLVEEAVGGNRVAGRSFLDIGANIGTSTVSALARFGARDAIAIEPDAENYRILRCNLVLNGLEDRCRTFNLALSDANASATLERSPSNSGDHRIRVAGAHGVADLLGEADRETEQVPVMRLDALAEEAPIVLEQVGLAWIDTQGHEAHVLGGASGLLSSGIPVVIEFWPYGLRRANGLERFCEIVAATYDVAVDVRASTRSGRIVRVPTAELPALTEQYPARTHTDLILVPR